MGKQRLVRFGPAAARITFCVTAVVLLARLAEFSRRYSVDVLYWDQWAFLEPFMRHSPLIDAFRWQHGPHRQGLAALVYAVILPSTSWSGMAEGFSIVVILAAACGVAVAVKVWTAGPLGWSDVSIPLAVFSLSCVEAFAGAPNLGNGPLPLLLCMLMALGLLLRQPAVRSTVVGTVGAFSVYTGFALFLAPLACALLLVASRRTASTRERAWPLGALGAVVLSSLSFFVGYRFEPASPCFQVPTSSLRDYVSFAGGMYARAWGLLSLQPSRFVSAKLIAGFGLFLATAGAAAWGFAVAWRAGRDRGSAVLRRRGETVFLLCGFSAVFVVFSSVGRTCLGQEASLASRYTLYLVPGIVGLYLTARAWPGRPLAGRIAVAAIVALLLLKERLWAFEWRSGGWMAYKKSEWAACYQTSRSIAGCDAATGFPLYPPEGASGIGLDRKLDYLEANRLSLFRSPVALYESGERIR